MSRRYRDRVYISSIRFIRTFSEVILGVFIYEVFLRKGSVSKEMYAPILAVAGLAGMLSWLSVYFFGYPKRCKVEEDGNLLIDRTGDTDIYRLDLALNLEKLAIQDTVTFKVINDAVLDARD